MSDPWAKPPRRPLPEDLEKRILRELGEAPARRIRPRHLIAPLAAAALVAATAVGAASLNDGRLITPAETASPYPSADRPTPAPTTSPSRTPTPSPTPVTNLDVRAMTKAEIKKDTKSCLKPDPNDTDPPPSSGRQVVRYAAIQQRGGIGGVSGEQVRTLMLDVGGNTWVCADGQANQWTRGPDTPAAPLTRKVPGAEIANYGGYSSHCGADDPQTTFEELFAVRDEVAIGRVRIRQGSDAGPWLVSRPSRGMIHLPLVITGADTRRRDLTAQYQLLDSRGKVLTLQPYGAAGTPTAKALEQDIYTCGNHPRYKIKPIKRPTSDKAGIKTCRSMAKEWAINNEVLYNGSWTTEVLISTPEEWGAVLSYPQQRFACSLFPTKEISAIVPDKAVATKSSFYFALNPIGDTGAESLWAAGRVPKDVTAISYRMPKGTEISAKLDREGYWMIKHHTAAGEQLDDEENVKNWEPVIVTVTRTSGTERFQIGFTTKTMCNQVSHGC